jgi:hypothetical protein
VRDASAYAEVTQRPLCVLSLDFKEAFDRISHTYLFGTMRSYGFSEQFVKWIQQMYTYVVSVGQINAPVRPNSDPLLSRPGYTLSMMLYAPVLEPADTLVAAASTLH